MVCARKSKTPPPSSCQVELVGVNTVIKEGLHVTQLLAFIQTKFEGPMAIVTDNKAAYDVIAYSVPRCYETYGPF